MKKFVLIGLVLWVAGYQWHRNHQPAPMTPQYAYTVAPEFFVRAEDLTAFGCHVDPRLGHYSESREPLLGLVQSYELRSQGDCQITLVSQIHDYAGEDSGDWAGVRASASVIARKMGMDTDAEEGNIGSYSEIHRFRKYGSDRGFIYAIQTQGKMYTISLISDTLPLTAEFEAMIRDKLARASL